ncbi:MAG: tetratricopeptide repeat protein 38 family protein [Rhodobacterales bacterium 32-66-7]|nr:MAG: tetratricopeptide repeat protein 38 family protein [Rhodobacterales bacterium 12-65-15]OYX27413.1 MAG: tetratricopeptide repeat protein 38 family protein [Rhodobacterales bacterium 32-66-7]
MPLSDDLSGMPTSLPAEVIGDWNAVILGVLSHAASTGPALNRVLTAAPDFALGQAIRGLSCLLLARSEMVAVAREAHGAALAAAPGTRREAAFVQALGDWLDGHPSQAAARMQGVLDRHPRDALAMKLIHAIHFIMGRPVAMRKSVEAVLPVWDDHPARGYLLGCHAFTLEETGEYAAAERSGRDGIDLCPDDAWGLHAVAHVHDMTGRARDGLDWLVGREPSWQHCNNFRFHVWWHRALMHLDLGEHDAVLALYDADIRADKTDDYRDIANAASLLSRLELEGVQVGDRWEELAVLAEHRATDGCLAFADLHYMLALCGGSRDAAAARLIQRMQATHSVGNEAAAVIAHPGLHVAKGILAFANGEYSNAWAHLRAGRVDLQSVGGSHAQRDVFDRITIEAALRGGYVDAAEGLLRDRMHRRAGVADGYAQARLMQIGTLRHQAV